LIYQILKKYILFFVITIVSITVKAQSGYNYQELGVGGGASYIRGYTNVQRQDNHPAFSAYFIYNYNPYLPIELEYQQGTLSGGGLTVDKDKYGRQYTNNYQAILLHADVQLGAAIDYEDSWILTALRNFYVGTGVGFISNNVTVQRTNVIVANGPLTYIFPGNNSSTGILLPLRFGYEFKIFDSYNEPSWAIDVGYIHSFEFGEGLDGYNDDPSKFKNNAIDQYRQIVVGVKYYFGTVVSYNKLIKAFR
jgi:hypothetical protein